MGLWKYTNHNFFIIIHLKEPAPNISKFAYDSFSIMLQINHKNQYYLLYHANTQ
jgi:hypothetical protein